MSRSEPLPADIFEEVNARLAVVDWSNGRVSIVCRSEDSGIVTKRQPTGLDFRYRLRGVFARWSADPRRRELRLPWVRGRFVLSDEEWNRR